MKSNSINIQNINDGLSANSLVPAGVWKENRTYKGSDGISHLVMVEVSEYPTQEELKNAKYYYAKKDNVNVYPTTNPDAWGIAPYFEYLVSASAVIGKLRGDQIESSAFAKRWMPLHEDYTAKDIYEYVKEGRNYYFILPKGDLHLPRLSNSSEIPVGTEISFLLPEDERDQKRYFKDAIPLRANFQDAGILQGNVNIGSAQLINICPIRCGVLHFQVAKSPTGKEWLWTNWSEFKNLDLLNEIRDIDKKAQRFISGGSRSIDANKISVIHCEDNLSSKSVLNLFNVHFGNDVTIIIPHWAFSVRAKLRINLFETNKVAGRCKYLEIDTAGVYKLYFPRLYDTQCYCIRVSDTFIDYEEGYVNDSSVNHLPNVNPWDLPGWWDDWKING